MTNIITVKNISKKYNITSQQGGYVALRDVLTNVAKKPFSFLKQKTKKVIGKAGTEEFWALKDINFEVGKGEAVGIIGANGAGKSTLLKILTEITPPTTGEIEMDGRVASLLEVGTGFHPELTGRENIFLNGAILGMTKKEISGKFNNIVEFAGINKFIDTPVKRYSSGMYVRLAFSVAAHMEPDILLVDEVLAVGDAEFQKKCLGKMDEVTSQGGRTILFVSHNMTAIQKLCKRCILLKKGEVKMIGKTKDVVAEYLRKDSQIENNNNLLNIPKKSQRTSDILFSKCSIINADNKITSSLKYGEPLIISLEAIANSKLKDLSFVVGINSANGTRIFTSVSEEAEQLFTATPNTPLKLTVKFPDLVLTPGYYRVTIAIRKGNMNFNKINLDILTNVINFKILNIVYKEKPHYIGTIGLIATKTQWKQK